jgi:hypothetical protein
MGEEREAVIRRALTHVHQTINLDGRVLARGVLITTSPGLPLFNFNQREIRNVRSSRSPRLTAAQ